MIGVTDHQLKIEIERLKEALTYVPRHTAFGDDNHEAIRASIAVLTKECDVTNEEDMDELSDHAQDAANQAYEWMMGDDEESPSSGWEVFKNPKDA